MTRWRDILADFKSYLMIERSLSANTVTSYVSDISKLAAAYPDMSPDILEGDDLAAFLGAETEKGISKRSQSRMVSSLKSFFGFLQIEGYRNDNPSETIDSPKISRYIPTVLSVKEVDMIIASVDLSKPQGHRDKAILEVLYSCGLRVSELTSLRISDLFFTEGFIRVTGKGDKQRLVPINSTAVAAVDMYIDQTRRGYTTKDDTLFLNRRGKPLTREMVFLIVKRQCAAASITKNVSPHTFRHSFATHMVENGADLRAVQEMLGHESILTTEIYTHIDSKKWQASILAFHPRG